MFNNTDKDLGYSLLFSYYIFYYQDKLFSLYKSDNDINLINAAKNIVDSINSIHFTLNNSFNINSFDFINFIHSLNLYFTFYKKWDISDILFDIDALYDKLLNFIISYKIYHKKNLTHSPEYNSNIININSTLSDIFNKNNKFAIKLFLSNYQHISIPPVIHLVWHHINLFALNHPSYIFILLTAYLKSNINSNFSFLNINDLKLIYYNIDLDSLINKFNSDSLYPSDISSILSLFNNIFSKYFSYDSNFSILSDDLSDSWSNFTISNFVSIFKLFYSFIFH